MGTYVLKRFTHPRILHSIDPELLLRLLLPYKAYFASRSLDLPTSAADATIDCEDLAKILANPAVDAPRDLLEALYLVDAMSTDEAMHCLIDGIGYARLGVRDTKPKSAIDIAVRAWLDHRGTLERKHAEQQIQRPKSFEYFLGAAEAPPQPNCSEPRLAALEAALRPWFEEHNRGPEVRVFSFPTASGGDTWFLIRHGESFKREPTVDEGVTTTVFFRPIRYDVVVHDAIANELRAHGCGLKELQLYVREIGRHLFGDAEAFPRRGKYTLSPLATLGEASLVCTDVDGIDAIQLKEVHFLVGGVEKETLVRKARDIFASLRRRHASLDSAHCIIRASFAVKFRSAKSHRTVVIGVPNTAQYVRDDDARLVEQWLTKRGFIVNANGRADLNALRDELLART